MAMLNNQMVHDIIWPWFDYASLSSQRSSTINGSNSTYGSSTFPKQYPECPSFDTDDWKIMFNFQALRGKSCYIYRVISKYYLLYIYNLFGIDWNFLKAPDPPSASVARHRWFCSTISWMPLWLDSLSQPLPGLWVGSIWFLAIEPWSSKPLLIDECPGTI